jgi:hypothetical protein
VSPPEKEKPAVCRCDTYGNRAGIPRSARTLRRCHGASRAILPPDREPRVDEDVQIDRSSAPLIGKCTRSITSSASSSNTERKPSVATRQMELSLPRSTCRLLSFGSVEDSGRESFEIGGIGRTSPNHVDQSRLHQVLSNGLLPQNRGAAPIKYQELVCRIKISVIVGDNDNQFTACSQFL